MDDTISRAAAMDFVSAMNFCGEISDEAYQKLTVHFENLPSAPPTGTNTVPVDDCISRQAAIDALDVLCQEHRYKIPGKVETYSQYNEAWQDALGRAEGVIGNLPSAEPKQRYTEEELSVFAHGISLSLLSKRSAQYWRYDKDTATEIEFLERLYDKVSADMKGGQG